MKVRVWQAGGADEGLNHTAGRESQPEKFVWGRPGGLMKVSQHDWGSGAECVCVCVRVCVCVCVILLSVVCGRPGGLLKETSVLQAEGDCCVAG